MKRLCVMLALLLIFAAGIYFLLRDGGEGVKEPETPDPLPEIRGTVSSVSIRNSTGAYSLKEDSAGSVPAGMIDSQRLSYTLELLGDIRAAERIGPEQPAYGFAEPACEAVVEYTGGSAHKIVLGNTEPVSGGSYCRFDDDKEIYLLSQGISSCLLAGEDGYLSLLVFPELRAASSVTAVTDAAFEWKDRSVRLISAANSGETELLSFGVITHLVEGPGVFHEADRAYEETVFDSVFGLTAKEIVCLEASEEEITELGFDDPDLKLTIGIKNGSGPEEPEEIRTLALVFEDDGNVLAMTAGSGAIYRCGRPAFADARYEKFILRQFLSPMLMDLSALEIDFGDRLYRFEIEGSGQEMKIRLDGEEIDLFSFREFYTLAVGAASDGNYLPDRIPEGDPLLTLRYEYRSADKTDDILECRQNDSRTCLVSVNGVCEFEMRSRYISALSDGIGALLQGQKIDQEW